MWLNRRGSKSATVGGKSTTDMVSEALMTELKYQLNTAHQRHLQKLEAERRQRVGAAADYSWLASNNSPSRRPYELPEMKRIELEQLCSRVCPTECGRVLLSFRQALVEQQSPPRPDDIPQLLRSTVYQVLSQRPATADTAKTDAKLLRQRLSRSLSNIRLRPSSRVSVAPVSIDEDSVSTSTTSSAAGLIAYCHSPDVAASGSDWCKVQSTSSCETDNHVTSTPSCYSRSYSAEALTELE